MSLRGPSASKVLAAFAHALAWAPTLVLLFWPWFYQGVAVEAVTPGAPAAEAARVSASLVAVNGWSVMAPLSVPVLLTAAALALVLAARPTRLIRLLTWLTAVLMFGFCVAGAFSIGLSYLPSAIALTVAAGAASTPGPRPS